MTPATTVQAAHDATDGERGASLRRRIDHPSTRITCNGCDHVWTARDAAHCGSCHTAPFSTAPLFDAHRRETGERGTCLDPGRVTIRSGKRKGQRVMYLRDGMWRGPEMSDEAKAKAFGGAR